MLTAAVAALWLWACEPSGGSAGLPVVTGGRTLDTLSAWCKSYLPKKPSDIDASVQLTIILPDSAGLSVGDSLRVTIYGNDLQDVEACPYHDAMIAIPPQAMAAKGLRYDFTAGVRESMGNYFSVTGYRDSSGIRLRILDENTPPVHWRKGMTEYRIEGLIPIEGADRLFL